MAQTSIASYFNTRKRANVDDAASIKNRRLIDPSTPVSKETLTLTPKQQQLHDLNDDIGQFKAALTGGGIRTRSGRTIKRIGEQINPPNDSGLDEDEAIKPKKISKKESTPQPSAQSNVKQTRLVEFIKKGPMSPKKRPSTKEVQKQNEETPSSRITTKATSESQVLPGAAKKSMEEASLKTPTKQIAKDNGSGFATGNGELKSLVKKELNFDEVKSKISRSAKLQELKASLARIQELEKTRKAQEERNRRLREGIRSPAAKGAQVAAIQLKAFDTIELEVLTSPSKTFKTPTKLPPPTPDKNTLMSPRYTDAAKRLVFSPSKDTTTPSKLVTPPAYQRFQSLVETSKAGQLILPYKYRHLIEIFKAVDSVCAMFHNRKECITFKKLKPAVQRMLRKNLTETHLAQIKHLYPEAFHFTQVKMRNYGSASKADYFQLVITPNVENLPDKRMTKIDEDNVLASAQTNTMNPMIMTERFQRFHHLLLEKAKEEHDKFLKSLDPPLCVPKEKVTRWHPEFDLENCPDIERGHLPQPPNVEKYSSAKDILSTARNLFNCATPMERAMERYEAKLEAERKTIENVKVTADSQPLKGSTPSFEKGTTSIGNTGTTTAPSAAPTVATSDATSSLLKGLPKSLIEKVRARQAAKALDAMTRRPSQDQEAMKYSRLPELSRHLRNVFVTERKGVLPLETVVKKIENSFRTSLNHQEIEDHLRLLAKEVPNWVAFHDVRKTVYIKISRDMDVSKIIEKLEQVANEKSK